MQQKTHDDYINLATYFIENRIQAKNLTLTPEDIRQALLDCAPEYRPNYWRRLRRAMTYSLEQIGHTDIVDVIRRLANPVTATNTDKKAKKPKQQRKWRVSTKEDQSIRRYLLDKSNGVDISSCINAALIIVNTLGCRPIEMMTLKTNGHDSTVFITGAKKRSDGLRGLNRTLQLTVPDFNLIDEALEQLEAYRQDHDLTPAQLQSRIQHGLARATKILWPKRKHRPTLYSYRHQLGSDLKASGKSRVEIAAIMGHQSVDSVDVYGDKRYGGREITIAATEESVSKVRKTVPKNRAFINPSRPVPPHAMRPRF